MEKIKIISENIKISPNQREYLLTVIRKENKSYRVEPSIINKLLSIYNLPIQYFPKLSSETKASICNDYLVQSMLFFVLEVEQDKIKDIRLNTNRICKA